MPRQPGPGPHNSQSAPGPRSARLPAASRHQSRPCPTAARSHGSLTPRLPVPAARSRLQPLFHFGRSSQLRLRRPLPTAARSQLRRGPVPRGPDPTAAGSHGGRIPQQPDPTARSLSSQVPQQPGPPQRPGPTAARSHSGDPALPRGPVTACSYRDRSRLRAGSTTAPVPPRPGSCCGLTSNSRPHDGPAPRRRGPQRKVSNCGPVRPAAVSQRNRSRR